MASLKIAQGTTSPSLTDTIKSSNQAGAAPFDLTGSTVKFRMREIGKSIFKFDAAAVIVNTPGLDGRIRYNWITTDLDTPGIYAAWWRITLPSGGIQEIPYEFTIEVFAHTMPGTILEKISAHIPNTFSALTSATQFGYRALQSHIATTKFRLFGTNIDMSLEATVYNEFVLDYAAKVSALRIIPAAIDFFSDRYNSIATKEESVTLPDKLKSLQTIHARLLIEVRQDEDLFLALFPTKLRRKKSNSPTVDFVGALLSPDPQDIGPGDVNLPFGRRGSSEVPWNNWR